MSIEAKRYPLQARLASLGHEFGLLQARLAADDGQLAVVDSEKIVLAIPLVVEGVSLGRSEITSCAR